MKAINTEMSMVNPSTDALMKKVDSRYGLVVLAAKRARQLLDGDEVKAEQARSTKNVTNALEEIVEGKISYRVAKENL
ncbi:DNA-directed RNA polymerase subunit omega [uncultured Mitsuokella sp.]|uniref:DNA-directed RNA polymerase subunit omega n=1 Tax=uncultured Mitsuokella sp. TaxID=453120 RepID=UPI00262CE980|nr:DNA-directed RNA polymerase subunit omega [uncultured Mitsuokella sp.]